MMFVLTLALSRLVPVLFGASIVLVAGRFLFDRYRRASPGFARAVMIAVYALGVIGGLPYLASSASLVTAEFWFGLDDWERAEHYFALSERLGGSLADATAHDRVLALMNSRRFDEAEEVLLSTVPRTEGRVKTTPETVYLLGISRYHQGRWQYAERALEAVEDHPVFLLKPYYLGRLRERHGDLDGALDGYRLALEYQPRLFSALYHAVRLLIARGDLAGARQLMERLPERQLGAERWPLLPALERAVSSGVPPPDHEFPLLIYK